MSDERRDHISMCVRAAMLDLNARNSHHPVFTGDGSNALREEMELAVRAAATDAYQRGASWGLQQRHPLNITITCTHAEVMVMGIWDERFYMIGCDDCDDDNVEGDFGDMHFDSEAAAIAEARKQDYQVTGDPPA